MRNIVEAIAFLGVFVLLFIFLPIPLNVRVILITIFGGSAAVFGYIGIKSYSVTEYLLLVINYKMKQNTFEKVDMFAQPQEQENVETQMSELPNDNTQNKKQKNKKKRG
ncbi:MAG: hypothetical protein ACI37Z_03330 [Candidatus Gastranaerophilaceae bacterium]